MFRKSLIIVSAIAVILLSSCGGPITKDTVENQTAVEVTHVKGKIFRGLVIDKNDARIKIVLEKDHKPYNIPLKDIQSIKEIDVTYDDYARPITASEISANKTYWRTISFAVMGGIFGGAVGFFAGGQANTDEEASVSSPATLIGAGVGAAVGVVWGLSKDGRKAEARVRAERFKNPPQELMQEKSQETEKLKKLEEEKKRLKEQLKNKK